MAWPEIEPSRSHLTYLLLSFFLIFYALFSELIRNRLHLSEPPLATLTGIIFGPRGLTVLNPFEWGWEDNITQELTRVVTGVQCFAVGVQLPAGYVKRHWRSIGLLLGPNMIAGWLVATIAIRFILNAAWNTAFITAACLTPTDPVLSASVIGEARFSQRVPRRIRHLLTSESGCNDGTAFPFLYAALYATLANSSGKAVRLWVTNLLLWQCGVGIVVGVALGFVANKALRFSEARGFVQESTLFVFYFLMAILCIGVGSTLGLDDFLVCFSAGTTFCWDGWFWTRTAKMKLPDILDLMLNSTMFVYLGSLIPWRLYRHNLAAWRMGCCTLVILIFRRLPAIVALRRWTPDIRTWHEALFVGHFGPIGVGALFLAIEARARLETGTSEPLPHPPSNAPHQESLGTVWPVVSFVVLCSIMVHGFSPLVMSLAIHFSRDPEERAPLLGAEEERLFGMASNEDENPAGQRTLVEVAEEDSAEAR